ncbi:hypothetical protein DSM104299_04083 [Baekduia alba]|uniref:peroxidase-related enzyme n=1 Tax=Baekduia alba TaxID=2997333 RepID=UPI0023407C8A|nr:peroxidase-related enzyme [Baekduia alba]WCB95340.1 hypothetical protein DSM104299_04083 [Baekduia alba]
MDSTATTSPAPSALRPPTDDELPPALLALMEDVRGELGFVPNFLKAYALNAEHLLAFFPFFTGLLDPDAGRLPARDRELLAVVVSAENRCNYCIATHAAILRDLTGDPAFVDRLTINHRHARLSARDRALAELAVTATRDAAGVTPEALEPLRALGLDDRQLLEAVEVIAAFNFTNRLANAIGLEPDPEFLAMRRDYDAAAPDRNVRR